VTVYYHHPKRSYRITDVTNVAQEFLPDCHGDVTVIATVIYAVQEITGAGTAGGLATCTPGANADLYNDGVDILQLQIAANGACSVIRTAGADTFNVRLRMEFL